MLCMGASRYQARVLRVLESNTTRAIEEALYVSEPELSGATDENNN